MNKRVYICLLLVLLGPALACTLASREHQSAAEQVSLQAGPTSVSRPTSLPIVEDIERVREETPEAASLVSANISDSLITDTIIAVSEEGASLAVSASDSDNDRESSKETRVRVNDRVTLTTVTTTPGPTPTDTSTPTPSPTLTPLPIVVSSGWPPILPDATDLEFGDGYVRYITGSAVGAVVDFYRREMALYGWAEMNEPELAAALGLTDFSTLVPMPGGGTLLIFSKDGGETLSFVIISDAGGQVGVILIWAIE